MGAGKRPLVRCPWPKSELDIIYHDTEWGVPQHDDRALFELLVLGGAQAGLSWATILNKRENYRRAFDNFDIAAVAGYGPRKIEALLQDAGIVRNRLKVESAVSNARAALAVRAEFGSLDSYLWGLAGGRPRRNAWRDLRELPARTPESDAMSEDLRRRGFRFAGSTICYALMQAAGMVNDHLVSCFRYREVGGKPQRASGGGPG